MFTKFTILVFALAFCSSFVVAQSVNHNVTGTVHATCGPHLVPLSNVTVVLQSKLSGLHNTTATLRNGTFLFTNVPAGSYFVSTNGTLGATPRVSNVSIIVDNTRPISRVNFTCSANATFESVPANMTVGCHSKFSLLETGYATYVDHCGNATLMFNDSEIVGDCPRSFNRTFILLTPTTNLNVTQKITIVDNQPPALVIPSYKEVLCNQTIFPNVTGHANATDNCDLSPAVDYTDALVGTCPNTTLRVWYATDSCGLTTSSIQVIQAVDKFAPKILTEPVDTISDCENIELAFASWVYNHGGLTAQDECSQHVTITSDSSEIPSCGTSTKVTFSAADECGNSVSASATFTAMK